MPKAEPPASVVQLELERCGRILREGQRKHGVKAWTEAMRTINWIHAELRRERVRRSLSTYEPED